MTVELCQMLKLNEVADLLGVKLRTVYRLIDAGELPRPIKWGGSTRMIASEFWACVERKRKERER